jgi:hypothetical protein
MVIATILMSTARQSTELPLNTARLAVSLTRHEVHQVLELAFVSLDITGHFHDHPSLSSAFWTDANAGLSIFFINLILLQYPIVAFSHALPRRRRSLQRQPHPYTPGSAAIWSSRRPSSSHNCNVL